MFIGLFKFVTGEASIDALFTQATRSYLRPISSGIAGQTHGGLSKTSTR